MLCAYNRELAQIHRSRGCERPRQRESSGFEERAAPGPAEAPEEASPDGSEEEGPSYGGMAMQ